ncbi:MAG: PilZ domain-containing protein [Spirochaetaceae bacterium]|nr:PilZ domain-containing protein [Spirochaetaceae bacterium]
MNIKRQGPRYQTDAGAKIIGVMENYGSLRDIDILGCKVESTMMLDIQQGKDYQIEIQPETASKIGNFVITGEVRWVHTNDYSFEIGFILLASPTGRDFKRYVDYLSYKPKKDEDV